ncbi:competence type IV pilus minor pilin ComGG [Metabacillus herbersteinensis]|uniref:Competence type IV pilus minor pilin ComGG n=1 Tax=Metabacillus herbersteinensis TaxID=283816 RepID=A0ABV6G8H6_9BACI
MLNSEKGYILPTTIVLALFCLMIVTHLSTILITETAFYQDTKQFYILENMMQVAVDASLAEINAGITSGSNTLTLPNGDIQYSIQQISPEEIEVQLTCTSTENNLNIAMYHYNILENKMSMWEEY